MDNVKWNKLNQYADQRYETNEWVQDFMHILIYTYLLYL